MNKSKLIFSLILALLFVSFNIDGNKQKYGHLVEENFNEFRYVYHFYKHELEESHIEPAAYKPKVFNIDGKIRAQSYEKDTLIKFIYGSKPGNDGTVELFRPLNFGLKNKL